MAKSYSLEELQSRYSTLKGLVTKAKKELAKNDTTTKIENLKKEIEILNNRKEFLAKVRDTYKEGTAEYSSYDKQYNQVLSDLQKAELDKSEKEKESAKKENALKGIKAKLSDYEAELNLILKSFAKDSRINGVLYDSLEVEYDTKIAQQTELINHTKTQSEDLANALKNNSILADLVSKLKKAFEEKKKFSSYSTDEAAMNANSTYANTAKNLRDAIKGIDEFKDIKLTDEDINAILSDGKILTKTIEAQESVKKELEEKKNKVLESVKNAKSIVTGDKKDLSKQKAEKENEIKKIEEDLKKNESSKNDAEDKVKALGYDVLTLDLDAEIQKLEAELAKGGVPEALSDAEKDELADLEKNAKLNPEHQAVKNFDRKNLEYHKCVEWFKDKGYIPTGALEQLVDKEDRENVTKLYNEFFEADQELRREFLQIKGNKDLFESKSKSENVKANLDKFIKNYQNKAEALSKATGFSVEDLHDYLIRDVLTRVDNKSNGFKVLPQEYITNSSSSSKRVSEFAKGLNNEDIDNLVETIKDLEDFEEAILCGKDKAVENYKDKLKEYIDIGSGIDIPTRNDIMNIINGTLRKGKSLFGFIKKIFNKSAEAIKRKFNHSWKKEPDGVKEKLQSLKIAENELEEARSKMEDAIPLTDNQKRRLNELKDRKDKREKALAGKSDIENNKNQLEELKAYKNIETTLKDDKSQLESDIGSIQSEIDKLPDDVEDIYEITDSGKIHDKKGTLYKDSKDSFER